MRNKTNILIIGEVYGYWEIIDICENEKYKHPKVEVLCTKCNKTKTIVNRYDLIMGKTRMCSNCSGTGKGVSKYTYYEGFKKGDWEVIKMMDCQVKCATSYRNT